METWRGKTWQSGGEIAHRGPEEKSTLGRVATVGKVKEAADISTAFRNILLRVGLRSVHQWLKDYGRDLRQSEILRLVKQFPELLH